MKKDKYDIRKIQIYSNDNNKIKTAYEIHNEYWNDTLDDGKGFELVFMTKKEAQEFLNNYNSKTQ